MDKKTISLEIVAAMIQRGYFDNIDNPEKTDINHNRITSIVDAYEEIISQIGSRQIEKLRKARETERKSYED